MCIGIIWNNSFSVGGRARAEAQIDPRPLRTSSSTAHGAQVVWPLDYTDTGNEDKSDSYFLLSNDNNVQRRKAGRARTFYDDCGAWDKKGGRISVYPYVTDSHGSVCRLFLIKKQYCFERKQNGCRIYDPLQPQPTPESVSTLTRYYIACGDNADFRKRVMWLSPSVGAPSACNERPVSNIGKWQLNYCSDFVYIAVCTV